MALKMNRQAVIPKGHYSGIIINAQETMRDFGKGNEPVVEVTIHPEYEVKDADVLPVRVSFPPVLNGISALSRFLKRLGAEPENGSEWEAESLIGKEVEFDAEINDNDFVAVVKNSIVRRAQTQLQKKK